MSDAISIVLCGDTLPVRRLGEVPPSARQVFEIAAGGDLTIGNFEIPLTDRGSPVHKLLNIRATPDIALDVRKFGLDVVTIANNHAVDYGVVGLIDTRQNLEAAGLTVIGAGDHIEDASRPSFHEVGGKRIAVVPFSCLTPTGMGASAERAGISALHVQTGYEIDPWYQMEEPGDPSVVRIRTQVAEADLRYAVDLVERTRRDCDILIVTIHWGFGSGEEIAEYQRPLAHRLIEAGADVIHGHHPHALHAFGFHQGKPIIYSAGTYVGQQIFLDASPTVLRLWAGMSPDGFVTTLRYADDGSVSVTLVPTVLDADRLPRLADGSEYKAILDRLQRLSADHGAELTADGHTILVRAIP